MEVDQEPWVQPPRAAGASIPSQREAPWQLLGPSCIAKGLVLCCFQLWAWFSSWENHENEPDVMGIYGNRMELSDETNHQLYNKVINHYKPRFDQPKHRDLYQ